MSNTIWLGAVAYDPKVVTIWEGMRRYFHDEARVPVEVVLFQSYEAQVQALLASPADPLPRIDIAWNTNLAYLQADEWSGQGCRPIAMRDTDLGWMTKIVAVSGGPVAGLERPHLGARQPRQWPRCDPAGSFSGAAGSGRGARLPHAALQQRHRQARRHRHERGRGGPRRARRPGRCRGGRQPVLESVRSERLVPQGGLSEIWSSPPYNHCMFTARPDLDREAERRFADALSGMTYDNPSHRAVLDAEGLRRWVAPHLDGYGSLRQEAAQQGFFSRPADA